MELVVNWTSMALILFLKSNMIDVIIAVVPFTTPFYILMFFVNIKSATYGNGMHVVEGFVVQPWLNMFYVCNICVHFYLENFQG
jgi:hypothetical protein